MSRLSGHRKSQSTSALNVIADGGFPNTPGGQGERRREKRASQHPTLGRVPETNVPVPPLPEFVTPRSRYRIAEEVEKRATETRNKSRSRDVSVEEVKGWMNDLSSLRSSGRRRNAALRGLERAILQCCAQAKELSEGEISLSAIINLRPHKAILTIVTRHAQALASRHPPKDAELLLIVSELSTSVGMLQGLCLLSRRCKEAVGEQHILEILIDLLLLLRTQPPPTAAPGMEEHHIVYTLLELLCCALVDSPENARTFEKLSGLEAVVRVLKGTGVAKEIRMKCLEFLYFYLQPEEANDQARKVSSSSTNSSNSGESLLYPPSPLSSSSSSIGSTDRISPSPLSSSTQRRFEDLDMPFIPQTPQKQPRPSLGYLTPSTRHVSGASYIASTQSLEPVPASPDPIPSMSATSSQSTSGTSERERRQEERDLKRWSIVDTSRPANAGLGRGLPKSSSMATSLSSAAGSSSNRSRRDVTAIKIDTSAKPSSTFSDPFSDTRTSSSGSSTVVSSRRPTGSGMSRSSTTSDLAASSQPPSEPVGLPIRRASMRRPARHAQSTAPDTSLPSEAPVPRAQKIRHSRTQSLLPSFPPPSPPPVPSTVSMIEPRRKSTPPTTTPTPTPTTPSVSMPPPPSLPTPAKRAFPVELTRGIPPCASSPALITPLGPARRVPSIKGADGTPRKPPKEEKGVKSFEEKKQLLSTWLGNVDALVEGVEKVSFWGSTNVDRKRS